MLFQTRSKKIIDALRRIKPLDDAQCHKLSHIAARRRLSSDDMIHSLQVLFDRTEKRM